MSLPPLFLEEAKIEDTSNIKLPHDVKDWNTIIIKILKEKYPEVEGAIVKTHLVKTNDDIGTATGAISIHDQKLKKTVYIPLIVKNFSLSPLDVLLVPSPNKDNQFVTFPLTSDKLKETLFSESAFDHIERPLDRIQQLYMNPQSSTFHPPGSRHTYASAGALDAIAGTIKPDQKEQFVEELKSNPEALRRFEKHAHLDLLRKVASDEAELDDAYADGVTLLKQDREGCIASTYTTDEIFDPIVLKGVDESRPLKGMTTEEKREAINDVKRTGEKLVVLKTTPVVDVSLGPNVTPENYTKGEDAPMPIVSLGSYKIQDKNGLFHEGYAIPTVVDFNMKPTGSILFFNRDMYAVQSQMEGYFTGSPILEGINYARPYAGATGVFIFAEKGKALSTIPFTIKTMKSDFGGQILTGEDFLGNSLTVKTGLAYGESLIAKVNGITMVPSNFKFVPLANFKWAMTKVANMDHHDATWAALTARTSPSTVKIAHTGALQFAVKGPDMLKMAHMCSWDPSNLSIGQTSFLLAAKKCPMEKIARIIKIAASPAGVGFVHGLPSVTFTRPVTRSIPSVNLVKQASYIDDTQVVDSVLSLNFINPENIAKFQAMIPLFEQCTRKLAQTLLASRLGMSEIPEGATSTAMGRLGDVIDGLKRLNVVEKKEG